ncbi:MAG: neutral zinc metallopeptidase [Acidimicrobiales bacterium]
MVKFRNSDGVSSNLEDRRAIGGRGVAMGGGLVGVIAVVLIQLLGGGGGSGVNVEDVFNQINMGGSSGTVDPADEPLVAEMSDALDDIQGFWASEDGLGGKYHDAKLVLFSGAVATGGCGNAPSSVGPFYCPRDENAYIDLSFFRQLKDQFGAPGDFAQVYVLAHELGHHVQNLLGTSDQVNQAQAGAGQAKANELSVRLELQADCYAGIWGHSAQDRGLIEPGDIDEGLGAAAAVGDDALGNGSKESWTHGSSESRQRWFRAGFDSGELGACDTFSVPAGDL